MYPKSKLLCYLVFFLFRGEGGGGVLNATIFINQGLYQVYEIKISNGRILNTYHSENTNTHASIHSNFSFCCRGETCVKPKMTWDFRF